MMIFYVLATPLDTPAIGHTFGVKVQKVQMVRPAFGRLVQRVVVAPFGRRL